MPITIRAKRDGFRRCGIAHSATPVSYPDDHFTEAELARLRAEPLLEVQSDSVPAKGAKSPTPASDNAPTSAAASPEQASDTGAPKGRKTTKAG